MSAKWTVCIRQADNILFLAKSTSNPSKVFTSYYLSATFICINKWAKFLQGHCESLYFSSNLREHLQILFTSSATSPNESFSSRPLLTSLKNVRLSFNLSFNDKDWNNNHKAHLATILTITTIATNLLTLTNNYQQINTNEDNTPAIYKNKNKNNDCFHSRDKIFDIKFDVRLLQSVFIIYIFTSWSMTRGWASSPFVAKYFKFSYQSVYEHKKEKGEGHSKGQYHQGFGLRSCKVLKAIVWISDRAYVLYIYT